MFIFKTFQQEKRGSCTPFKCLNFFKSFAAMYSSDLPLIKVQKSFYIQPDCSRKEPPKQWVWKLQRICGISKSELKQRNFKETDKQPNRITRGPFCWPWALARSFVLSRVSMKNLVASLGYLRYTLNYPACSFFLEHTSDRQRDLLSWMMRSPAYCTGPEARFDRPKNKICYKLRPKHNVFFLFSNNLLVLRHF